MTRLGRLLGALGARELGRRLGRTPGTVRRWARAGVPAVAEDDLRGVDRRRRAARARAKAIRIWRDRLESRKKEAGRKEKEALRARARREVLAKEERDREERVRAETAKKKAVEVARKKAALEAAKKKAEEEAKKKAVEVARKKAELEAAKKKAEEEAKKKAAEVARKKAELETIKKRLAEKKAELEKRRSEIAEACRLLNSNRAIAEAIGVDEATIRRWMMDPPLKSAAFDRLRMMVSNLHTLAELMKQAGEISVLPTVRSGHGERSGRKTEGVYWTRVFMTFLNERAISTIGNWVRNHHGDYPYWQAVAVTSQYALRSEVDFADAGPKNTDRDYKTVFVQVGQAKWGDFAADRPEPTSEKKSANAAARDIEHRLRARMESGIVQVYIHGVTLFAYRRRSKEEESRWTSVERRERQEQWRQKLKRRQTKKRRLRTKQK